MAQEALKKTKKPEFLTTVSYSRLTTYDKCPELFRLIHADKILPREPDTVATRLGGICHESLEDFYGDETGTIQSPYDALVREEGIWDRILTQDNLLGLKEPLQAYAHYTTQLFARASASYKGRDAIRKSDGSVSYAPQMTGAWKDAARQYGLNQKAGYIDNVAAKAGDRWKDVSLSEVYAGSLGIMYTYQHDPRITSVVAIELPIGEIQWAAADAEGNQLFNEDGTPVLTNTRSKPYPLWVDPETGKNVQLGVLNEFFLPELDANGKLKKTADGKLVYRKDVLFNGYIDWLVRDEQGRLIITDHKTNSGEPPTPMKVSRHEQMNLYGLMIEEVFGETPYALAMNHLKSGKLILAPYSREKAEKAIERLLLVEKATRDRVFIGKDPDAYGTRCVEKGQKAGEYRLCYALQYCHPEVYAAHKGLSFNAA